MAYAPIGVVAVMPMVAIDRTPLHRIRRIGRLDAEQALNAADNAADNPSDHGSDRPSSLSTLISTMRDAAGNTLRLRR